MKFNLTVAACASLLLASCANDGWTNAERDLIATSPSVMKVYVMPADSAVLRAKSTNLDKAGLSSALLDSLIKKMMSTVTDPSQDGVGIAAPQVGINRRVVCVQRFDKEGEPFEAYVNIQVDSLYGEIVRGREGCLSIPGYRGIVPRFSNVDISHTNPRTGERIHESIGGFSAIIFQHEYDHLDGILYTDRADTLYRSL